MTSPRTVCARALLAGLAIGGCSADPGAEESASAASLPTVASGRYATAGPGAIAELNFYDATHYALSKGGCTGEDACIERGTFSIDPLRERLALRDEAGKTTELPFKVLQVDRPRVAGPAVTPAVASSSSLHLEDASPLVTGTTPLVEPGACALVRQAEVGADTLRAKGGSGSCACPMDKPLTCQPMDTGGNGYGTVSVPGMLWGTNHPVVKYGTYSCVVPSGATCSFVGPGNANAEGYDLYGVKSENRYIPFSGTFRWVPVGTATFVVDPSKPSSYPPEFFAAMRSGVQDCKAAGTCTIAQPPSNK